MSLYTMVQYFWLENGEYEFFSEKTSNFIYLFIQNSECQEIEIKLKK